ncbi:MAG: hypothetical protein GEU68_13905 [Actinobacteria bacterium]|nr:hypothetical protein [Actinomycetota bacterium]
MSQAVEQHSIEEQSGQFVERMFGSLVGAIDLFSIDLGRRLGLYGALMQGPATSAELAERAGCDERYVREWLEHQTVVGIIEADDPAAAGHGRRYSIPGAHRESLLDPDSLGYVGGLAYAATVLARPVECMVEAFRTGDGVP